MTGASNHKFAVEMLEPRVLLSASMVGDAALVVLSSAPQSFLGLPAAISSNADHKHSTEPNRALNYESSDHLPDPFAGLETEAILPEPGAACPEAIAATPPSVVLQTIDSNHPPERNDSELTAGILISTAKADLLNHARLADRLVETLRVGNAPPQQQFIMQQIAPEVQVQNPFVGPYYWKIECGTHNLVDCWRWRLE